jgi:hypothetical protein
MGYTVSVAGFEGQKMEVRTNMWSGSKLYVNGQPAPKGSKRGEMLLTSDDGRQVAATWKQVALGFDVPQLSVDGKVFPLVEPLKWYHWLWGIWPVGLLFVGGALGAIIGLIAFSFNAQIFRSKLSPVLQFVATAAVSGAAVALYLIVAGMAVAAING